MTLLATPISGTILRALADGPKRLLDLRRECGSPAQTTLRAYLKELQDAEAIKKHRGRAFPGAIECELTPAGWELLFVADSIERWLEKSPEGPVAFGGPAAKAAIKALADGWSSTMIRALAARPLCLTELDGVITSLSYPSLERRLSAMKLANQVESCPGDGKGTPYAPTRWLREAIAPLTAAAGWEQRHTPTGPPIARIDIEAAFLLALPLVSLPYDLAGSSRLGIEVGNGTKRHLVGAMANVEDGKVVSCAVRLERNADAWATGSISAWLQALIGSDMDGLELGGDQRFARALIDSLHEVLFGDRAIAL
jgi:DNA-binding HxlR family transcriptional regulator